VFDGTNVGIGVTPSAWGPAGTYAALQVGPAGGAQVNLAGGDASLGANFYISAIGTRNYQSSGVGASRYQFYNGSHVWFIAPSGTAGAAISFTQAMTLDASGNLGLGSAAPVNYSGYSTLTIQNTSGGVINLRNATATVSAEIALTPSEVYFSAVSALPLTLKTTNTERMRITSTGNVGIGTSSPTSNLSVYSTDSGTDDDLIALGFSVFSPMATIGTHNLDGNSGGIKFSTRASTVLSERMRITAIGDVLINTNTSLYGFANNPSLELNGAAGATLGLKVGNVAGSYISHSGTLNIFNTTNNSIVLATNNSERMRITAGGDVSIGTSSALGGKLNVFGGPVLVQGGAGLAQGVFGSTSTTVDLEAVGANAVRINTNSAERMRITSAGDVGIGTPTPRGNLSVGTDSSANNTEKSIHLGYTAANFYGFRLLNLNSPSLSYAGTFSVQRGTGAAWSDALLINDSGNVGIGTASPTTKVQINSDGPPAASGNMNTGMSVASAAGSFAINIGANATGGYTWLNSAYINSSNTASPMVLMTGAAERMRITSAGDVGIGTSAPGSKIEVFGGTVGTTAGNEVLIANQRGLAGGNGVQLLTRLIRTSSGTDWTTTAMRLQGRVDATDFGYVDLVTGGGANLSLGIGATEMLRIASAGQIGIGGANYGTAGQVLTSAGSGAAPSWATPSGGLTRAQATAISMILGF
jgi:hypothetical protein